MAGLALRRWCQMSQELTETSLRAGVRVRCPEVTVSTAPHSQLGMLRSSGRYYRTDLRWNWASDPWRSVVNSPLIPVSPRRFRHANGTHLALVVPELPGPGPWMSEPQPTNVNHDGGSSNDQARVCQSNHHWASATLPEDVRESKPRRQKRDGGPSGDDFFVPKQLGWGCCLGLVCASPASMVRRCPRSSAPVRRRCHAVRHAPGAVPGVQH